MEEENPQNVQLSNDDADTDEGLGACNCILVVLASILVVVTFPFSLFCALKVLQEYERGIVLRLGRVVSNRPKGPGLIFVFPCIDELRIVDVRTFYYDIQPQKILTKDSMTVTVDAVVYGRLINARQGALSGNIPLLTGRWTAAALCKVLAAKTLTEILGDREKITKVLRNTLFKQAHRRGVKIERVEIKNVRLPPEMQRAMAVEAETARDAKAKVIAANGEMQASQALKQAADIINLSPAALKLRYLQTLHSIAPVNNRTIILPLPEGLPERFIAWLASRFSARRSNGEQRHERRQEQSPGSRQVHVQEHEQRNEQRQKQGHESRHGQREQQQQEQRTEQRHERRQEQSSGRRPVQVQEQEQRNEQRQEQGHELRHGQRQQVEEEQRNEQRHERRQEERHESRLGKRHEQQQQQQNEQRRERIQEQGHDSRHGPRQEQRQEQGNEQRHERRPEQGHESRHGPRQEQQQRNGQMHVQRRGKRKDNTLQNLTTLNI